MVACIESGASIWIELMVVRAVPASSNVAAWCFYLAIGLGWDLFVSARQICWRHRCAHLVVIQLQSATVGFRQQLVRGTNVATIAAKLALTRQLELIRRVLRSRVVLPNMIIHSSHGIVPLPSCYIRRLAQDSALRECRGYCCL